MPRFVVLSEAQVEEKQVNLQKKNTIAAEKKAERAFRDFLSECPDVESTNFFLYDEETLDKYLRLFYFGARQKKDPTKKYTVSSLEQMRNSLSRALKRYGHKFDICKSPQFTKSIEGYKDACKELKAEGYGVVKSHKAITPDDLKKLYNHPDFDPDYCPASLQNKVQFDVHFYFARCGDENMHMMTKDTFAVFQDSRSGLRYVKKVRDEMQKNHQECDGEIITGFMPEIQGDPKCPVQSFEMYLHLLNPRCESLWQRPLARQNAEGDCYCRRAVGHNTLGSFMSTTSKNCKLSQRYTNHDIRVTSCTLLFHCKFTNKEIMAISGHKSVNSLAIYQKVNFEQKIQMGKTFNIALTNPEKLRQIHPSIPSGNADLLDVSNAADLLALLDTVDKDQANDTAEKENAQQDMQLVPFQQPRPSTPQMPLVPVPEPVQPERPSTSGTTGMQSDPEVPNFDILDFLNDLDDEHLNTVANPSGNVQANVPAVTQNTVVSKRTNMPQMPLFNNCKIGKINININKV